MKNGHAPAKLALMMINFSAENGVLPEKYGIHFMEQELS